MGRYVGIPDKFILQPEGRRLEFKEKVPAGNNLAKTVIALANDAGGVIFIGVRDNPREVIGVSEEDLLNIEEQLSNIIINSCTPAILPEISFLKAHGKHIVKVEIYKGNKPPYHLKYKSITEGTYIRVGSSNRLADEDIIEELERLKRNIPFDAMLVYDKELDNLDYSSFINMFEEKTGESVDHLLLNKLELNGTDQGKTLPTHALVLLSDDRLKTKLFPYAKIECARFKGTVPGDFIDQKTIDVQVGMQPEQAYRFVLRHISQGSEYEGVYRKDRWEYPVIAIREAIRNAVIHREYSLKGKDIKIAIFDDKIEITSPGKLLPSIDFNDMESGQSDIRNKTLAPVFKRLGIIEQWGNGLQLIADQLKEYPEIELKWSEPGIAFRVTFLKKNYDQQQELRTITSDYGHLRPITTNLSQQELEQELQQELEQESMFTKVLILVLEKPKSRKEISISLGQKSISGRLNEVLKELQNKGLIEWTLPDKPNSSRQEYRITQKGMFFYKLVKKEDKE